MFAFTAMTGIHFFISFTWTNFIWLGFYSSLLLLFLLRPTLKLSDLNSDLWIKLIFAYVFYPIVVVLAYKVYVFRFEGKSFSLENYFFSGSTILCSPLIIFCYLIFTFSQRHYKHQYVAVFCLMYICAYLLDSRLGKVTVIFTLFCILISPKFKFRIKTFFIVSLIVISNFFPLLIDSFDNALRTDGQVSQTFNLNLDETDFSSPKDVAKSVIDWSGLYHRLNFSSPQAYQIRIENYILIVLQKHLKIDHYE